MTTHPDPSKISVRSCLTFLMDGEEYAIELHRVREIVRYEGATRVPRVPACVRGVINLRGSVVPVVDLAVALGMREAPVTKWTSLVIVETLTGGRPSPMGLITESVSRVLEIKQADLEPAPAFGTRMPSTLLLGLTRVGEHFVRLLDTDPLLGEGGFLQRAAAGKAAVDLAAGALEP